MANVSDAVSDYSTQATAAVRQSPVAQYIAANPVPIMLIGAGIGMLAFSSRRQNTRYDNRFGSDYGNRYGTSYGASDGGRYENRNAWATTGSSETDSWTSRASDAVTSAASSVRDTASDWADTTREQFNNVSEQARQQAQVAAQRARSVMQENPLAVGIAMLAAGAIIGLAIPNTDVENQYFGETRDQLLDKAKSAARETADKAQHVAQQAGESIKEAAQREGLMTPA